MKIKFKLFASLTDYLPSERKGNVLVLDVDQETTVQQMIDAYRIPEHSAHLVLVNGVFIPRGERPHCKLTESDELAIWPPVAGG